MISHKIQKTTNILIHNLLLLPIRFKTELDWHKMKIVLNKYIYQKCIHFLLWGNDHYFEFLKCCFKLKLMFTIFLLSS